MRWRLPCMIGLLLAGVTLAVAQSETQGDRQLVEDIVCWVNDDIITLSELLEQEQQAVTQVLQNRSLPADELARRVNEVKQQVLMEMIKRLLLLQEAEQLFDIDAVKKDLVQSFMKKEGVSSNQELDELLRTKYRMTRDDLERTLLLMTMPDYVIDTQVRNALGVPEQEARAYYEQHKDRFSSRPSVTFREIVLLSENADDPQALATRAERIASEAAAGADFGDLVQRYSESPSKSVGGRIGPIDPRDLRPEIARALMSLDPGRVSAPIQTERGWHILQLEERKDAVVQPFESVRDECEKACRERKFQQAYDKYLNDLIAASRIGVRSDYADRIPEKYRDKIAIR